jgi:hypothetical protein
VSRSRGVAELGKPGERDTRDREEEAARGRTTDGSGGPQTAHGADAARIASAGPFDRPTPVGKKAPLDRFEFAASVIRSLAWPAAVVLIVFLFRSSIRSALTGPIKRWKVGPTGAEVEYWEQAASEALEQLPPNAAEKAEEALGGGLAGELTPLAEIAPSAAVMEAFVRIEREVRRIVMDPPSLAQPRQIERMGGRQLAVIAHQDGRISDQSLNAIDGLVVMRNLAAHGRGGEIDTDRALEFVHLADAVLYALGRGGGR